MTSKSNGIGNAIFMSPSAIPTRKALMLTARDVSKWSPISFTAMVLCKADALKDSLKMRNPIKAIIKIAKGKASDATEPDMAFPIIHPRENKTA